MEDCKNCEERILGVCLSPEDIEVRERLDKVQADLEIIRKQLEVLLAK